MFDGALIAGADPVDLRRGVLDEVPAEAAPGAVGDWASAGGWHLRRAAARPAAPARTLALADAAPPGGTGTGRVIGSSSIPASGHVPTLWPAATRRSSRALTTG